MISGLIQSIKAGFQTSKSLWAPISEAVTKAFTAIKGGNFGPAFSSLKAGGDDAYKLFKDLPKGDKSDFLKFAGATVAGGVVAKKLTGGGGQQSYGGHQA